MADTELTAAPAEGTTAPAPESAPPEPSLDPAHDDKTGRFVARDLMVDYIERGRADTLDEAYDMRYGTKYRGSRSKRS